MGGSMNGYLSTLAVTSSPSYGMVGFYQPAEGGGPGNFNVTPYTVVKPGPYLFSVQLNVAGNGVQWSAGTNAVWVQPLINGAPTRQSQVALYAPVESANGQLPMSQDTRQVIIPLSAGDVVTAQCVMKGQPSLGTGGSVQVMLIGLLV